MVRRRLHWESFPNCAKLPPLDSDNQDNREGLRTICYPIQWSQLLAFGQWPMAKATALRWERNGKVICHQGLVVTCGKQTVQFLLKAYRFDIQCPIWINNSKIPNVQKFLYFIGFRCIHIHDSMYIYKHVNIHVCESTTEDMYIYLCSH